MTQRHRHHLRRRIAGLIVTATLFPVRGNGAAAPMFSDSGWRRTVGAPPSEACACYETWLHNHAGDAWASVVIVRGQVVCAEAGIRSSTTEINDCGSLRKPLQATVLGVALAQRRLRSIDEDALPYWHEPYVTPYENDRHITFRQFVTFLDRWNEPEPPGSFHYNNASATAAGACIAGLFVPVHGSRPEGIAEVVRREIMSRIDADWGLGYSAANFSAQSWNSGPQLVFKSSVEELAKFGYLWLRHGCWGHDRLFSEAFWREAVSDWSPHTGSTESGLCGHYGYGWFVNAGKVLLPDLPEDAFYAIGNGQPKRATILLVAPSLDAVAILSMERMSDDGKWDAILNSRVPSNDGPRQWAREVGRLLRTHEQQPVDSRG